MVGVRRAGFAVGVERSDGMVGKILTLENAMATATITSKGQITIPRAVREVLELHEGDRLEFIVESDGTLRVRPLKGSVRDLFGLLEREGAAPVSIAEMSDGIAEALAAEDERIRPGES